MEIAVGRVVEGKVVVDGAPLREGATVAVLIDDDTGFEVTTQEKEALLASIAEARRGEVIDGWNLLDEIRSDR